MIFKLALAVITILAVTGGIFALTGEPAISAAFSFGAAALAAIILAFRIGSDNGSPV